MPKGKIGEERDGIGEEAPGQRRVSRSWTKNALFFSFTIVVACAFSLVWLSKDTGADLGLKGRAQGVEGALFALGHQERSKGLDLEVSAKPEASIAGPLACRWWLNGYPIEGYGKRTFPGMGLRKGDEVRVEVLNPSGEVIAKKRLRMASSPLALINRP